MQSTKRVSWSSDMETHEYEIDQKSDEITYQTLFSQISTLWFLFCS